MLRGEALLGLRVLETWFSSRFYACLALVGLPVPLHLSSHPDANFTSDFTKLVNANKALPWGAYGQCTGRLVVVGLLKSARFLFCCDCDARVSCVPASLSVVCCGANFLGPPSLFYCICPSRHFLTLPAQVDLPAGEPEPDSLLVVG